MEDGLEGSPRPSDPQRPVVGMDEIAKHRLRAIRDPEPAARGRPGRVDDAQARGGVVNGFRFGEPLPGQRGVDVTLRRTKRDWAEPIRELVDVRSPEAERIVLVLDNLHTHTPAALYEAFAPAEAQRLTDKLELHSPPKHGSWLNIAEIELSVLSRQCLDRRVPDVESLQGEVAAWQERRNTAARAVDWRFTTQDARIKLRRLYPSLQE